MPSRVALISPVNRRNTEYTADSRAGPALGLWRLKHFVESRTSHEIDVFNSDLVDPRELDYSDYDYVGICSYYPTRLADRELGLFIRQFRCQTPLRRTRTQPSNGDFYRDLADAIIRGEGERAVA